MSTQLIYVHDPMCSWCWGFRPSLATLRSRLPASLGFRRLLGGLAADTAEPMPPSQQQMIQATWHRITERIPGTRFNFEFWQQCTPRRSTYPACRAVLAARACQPNSEDTMIGAIQEAYYLRAMNPSDDQTLLQLAEEIGLPATHFRAHFFDPATSHALQQEITQARSLGADSFPSLILHADKLGHWPIAIDYTEPRNMIESIQMQLDQIAY